ncbi:membrane-associated protein, putative [Bodo saltans]|uniref:Membrane-associated protein, putative n=1 Tax=Bodo saltans TaxID=75058 RepID=A0A0S4ILA4_BODSA|nr:membrane-associated protein, putative [Bodo saltans]|eukprot:CUE70044.1 membrane-associated protein, putative [Bodo saltans]
MVSWSLLTSIICSKLSATRETLNVTVSSTEDYRGQRTENSPSCWQLRAALFSSLHRAFRDYCSLPFSTKKVSSQILALVATREDMLEFPDQLLVICVIALSFFSFITFFSWTTGYFCTGTLFPNLKVSGLVFAFGNKQHTCFPSSKRLKFFLVSFFRVSMYLYRSCRASDLMVVVEGACQLHLAAVAGRAGPSNNASIEVVYVEDDDQHRTAEQWRQQHAHQERLHVLQHVSHDERG